MKFIFPVLLVSQMAMGATYYLANTGNDNADGSQGTPWATISKVNSANLAAGDSVLFNKGDTWREQMSVSKSGTVGNPITFGAYGTGAKPLILGSTNVYLSTWTLSAANVYYTPIAIDIGNLIFNSEASVGVKKSALNSLGSQGDFFWDSGANRLYLYSASNPTTFYSAIEGAKNVIGIIVNSGVSNIVISSFDLRYQGGLGIDLDGYAKLTDRIIVQYCNVAFVGGAWQFGTTRYGNGVQVYDASANVIVRYNTFNQIYDSAITTQGSEAGMAYTNHQYYCNIVQNSEYGGEWFITGAGSTFDGCYIYNNVFYNNGGGWAHAQRPDPNGTALMLWDSVNGGLSHCYFENNIIHTSANQHINVYDPNDLSAWTIDYNDYYQDGSAAFKRFATSTTFAAWKTATSQDAHSVTTDPLFANTGTTFSLRADSPVTAAGIFVNLPGDFVGNSFINPPSMGAYEFGTVAKLTTLNATKAVFY